jgi:uncharacterized protein YkwD
VATSSSPFVASLGDEIGPLIGRLRDPKLSIDEREKIQGQLLALGDDGARALQKQIEEQFERADKREMGREKHYFDEFARAADKLVAGRLDKAALKEVDKLRDEVNALSRIENLTKEQIHEVGDPRLKRLKELLVVAPDDVLAADAELAPARQALVDDTYELEEDFKVWAQCNAALPEKKRSKTLVDPSPRYPRVLTEERWLAALATPMSKSDKEALLGNRPLDPQLDPEEAAGILDLNLLRIRLGLRALTIDLKLCNAARDHSHDMRTLGFFAHESPVEGKHTPWDRAARAGTSASAENIAGGQTTGAGANEGWWYSPGHHKNMTGDHARVGLGRSETIWTQMFG